MKQFPTHTNIRRGSIRCLCLLTAFVATLSTGCDDPDPEPAEVDPRVYSALGQPFGFATDEQRETFVRGEEVATRVWTIEDGLGPEFNVSFCTACHENPVAGGSGARYRDFFIHGWQQDGVYRAPPVDDQGNIVHTYGVGDAEVRPEVDGFDEERSFLARRSAPPIFGTGLIAAIDGEAIRANADPDDLDGDGISGRVNCSTTGFIGRFGRKAQTESIEGFIRGPIFNHLQISNDPLDDEALARLPIPSNVEGRDISVLLCGEGAATAGATLKQVAAGQDPLVDTDDVADPELAPSELFDLVAWNMMLGAPEPGPATEESERGEVLFASLGCASCHTPTLDSEAYGPIPLYSDLLLHDMGPENDETLEMGIATGSEFRTQPLWGIAATSPYWHDGRADTLEQAIMAHGGEGDASRQAFAALDQQGQQDVIAFLHSLGGAEFAGGGFLPVGAPIPEPGVPGAPIQGLDDAQLAAFDEGRMLFDRDFTLDEGIGDLMNGDGCRACHFQGGTGGAGTVDVNVIRHGALTPTGEFTAPGPGTTLFRISAHGSPVLRGEVDPNADSFELRQTPAVFGLGLFEAVDTADILALADPEDEDEDGIAGRAHLDTLGRVGRFGLKSQIATLREFVRDALSNELGLTLPVEEGVLTGVEQDADVWLDPESDIATVDQLEFYIANLAFPDGEAIPDAHAEQGAELFEDFGCASCHIPSFDTDQGQVRLFTDFLLHRVQEPGYRGVPEGDAGHDEFRTPTLRGLIFSGPYWHDGLSGTLDAAVRRHDSTARASRESYEAASESDRELLLQYLRSL